MFQKTIIDRFYPVYQYGNPYHSNSQPQTNAEQDHLKMSDKDSHDPFRSGLPTRFGLGSVFTTSKFVKTDPKSGGPMIFFNIVSQSIKTVNRKLQRI
jgi:hypothetical protein